MQYKINQNTLIFTTVLAAAVGVVVVWATRGSKNLSQQILDYMYSKRLYLDETYSCKIDENVVTDVTFQQDQNGVYLLLLSNNDKIYIVKPTKNGLTGILDNKEVFISDFQSIEGHMKHLGVELGVKVPGDLVGDDRLEDHIYVIKKNSGLFQIIMDPEEGEEDEEDYILTNITPIKNGFSALRFRNKLYSVILRYTIPSKIKIFMERIGIEQQSDYIGKIVINGSEEKIQFRFIKPDNENIKIDVKKEDGTHCITMTNIILKNHRFSDKDKNAVLYPFDSRGVVEKVGKGRHRTSHRSNNKSHYLRRR